MAPSYNQEPSERPRSSEEVHARNKRDQYPGIVAVSVAASHSTPSGATTGSMSCRHLPTETTCKLSEAGFAEHDRSRACPMNVQYHLRTPQVDTPRLVGQARWHRGVPHPPRTHVTWLRKEGFSCGCDAVKLYCRGDASVSPGPDVQDGSFCFAANQCAPSRFQEHQG